MNRFFLLLFSLVVVASFYNQAELYKKINLIQMENEQENKINEITNEKSRNIIDKLNETNKRLIESNNLLKLKNQSLENQKIKLLEEIRVGLFQLKTDVESMLIKNLEDSLKATSKK